MNLADPDSNQIFYMTFHAGPLADQLSGANATTIDLSGGYDGVNFGSSSGAEDVYWRPWVGWNGTDGQWHSASGAWMLAVGGYPGEFGAWQRCPADGSSCYFPLFGFTSPFASATQLLSQAFTDNQEYDQIDLPGPGHYFYGSEFFWEPFAGQDTVGGTKATLYMQTWVGTLDVPNCAPCQGRSTRFAEPRVISEGDSVPSGKRRPPGVPPGTPPTGVLPVRVAAATEAHPGKFIAYGIVVQQADGTIIHDTGRISCNSFVIFPHRQKIQAKRGQARFIGNIAEACVWFIPKKLHGQTTRGHWLVSWIKLKTPEGVAFAPIRTEVEIATQRS